MKLAPHVVIVVALAAPGAWGVNLGCSHDARPAAEPIVEPDDHPPLPPAAGTPIGHLVDDAAELKLTDDQLAKLQVINDDLAQKLAVLDGEMVPEPLTPPPAKESKARGLGFRAGGQGNGASPMPGGAPGAGTSTGAGDMANDGPVTTQYAVPAETVTRVFRARARNVKDAIGRALALLDVGQRVIAKRVLVDHGVNLENGDVSRGEPGAAKLEDPKLGQPLPREQGEP